MSQSQRVSKWVPQNIEATRKRINQENDRKLQLQRRNESILGQILKRTDDPPKFQTRYPFKRRYKTTQVAGIFAHAVHSNEFESFSSHYTPRKENRKTSPERDEPATNHDSEDADSQKNSHTVSPPLPKKQNSDLETDQRKKWDFVESLSSKLDTVNIPNIYIREENKLTLSDFEFKILERQLNEENKIEAINVMRVMQDRVDWLLCLEDFEDKTDIIPDDPSFLTDVISRRYENFEANNCRNKKIIASEHFLDGDVLEKEDFEPENNLFTISNGFMKSNNDEFLYDSPNDIDIFQSPKSSDMFTASFVEWSKSRNSVEDGNGNSDLPSSSSSNKRFSFI